MTPVTRPASEFQCTRSPTLNIGIDLDLLHRSCRPHLGSGTMFGVVERAHTMKRSTPTVKPTRDPIYTIGHSTRTHTELVDTLRAWKVSTLVDIRRFTRSRTNPQFNERVLGPRLRKDGIVYLALPALGGRRAKSKVADPMRNAGWQN